MSIKSAFWAVRYGLSFSAAGQLDDVMRSISSRKITFSTGESLITARRTSLDQPIRGNVSENGHVYAISKDSMHLVQSPLLKIVLRLILTHNKLHGGKSVSSNAKAWRKDYDQQR